MLLLFVYLLAAEIQWSLLPPLSMTVPQVEVAGILEPAYDVAGDSFDYALNGDILHVAVIDAMGHGLDEATMATVAVGAYRHARRADTSLSQVYAFMDTDGLIEEHQPGGEEFGEEQLNRRYGSEGFTAHPPCAKEPDPRVVISKPAGRPAY